MVSVAREGMKGAALAFSILCTVVVWRCSNSWKGRQRNRKRVSFSEADNTVVHISLEDALTDEEKKAVSYTPEELQEFARSLLIEEWLRS